MVDYEKMYYELFNAITESVVMLQQAQINAEEIYMSTKESASQLLPADAENI